jgi:hypothetical protein
MAILSMGAKLEAIEADRDERRAVTIAKILGAYDRMTQAQQESFRLQAWRAAARPATVRKRR